MEKISYDVKYEGWTLPKNESTDAKYEGWVNSKWRPMMGWMYMIICLFDFVAAPIGLAMLQASLKLPIVAWAPLTLQGAGLFHLSMAAILGVAAWTRGQERVELLKQK